MSLINKLIGDEISGENKIFVNLYFDKDNIETSVQNLKGKVVASNPLMSIDINSLDYIIKVCREYLELDKKAEQLYMMGRNVGKSSISAEHMLDLFVDMISASSFGKSPVVEGDEYSEKVFKTNGLLDDCRRKFNKEVK